MPNFSISKYVNVVAKRDAIIKSDYTDEVKIAYGDGRAEWKTVRTKNNRRHSHLWCYSFNALDNVAVALKKTSLLHQTYSDFEELYWEVKKCIGSLPMVGATLIYDVALYIGTKLPLPIYPMKYVYVHGKLIAAAATFLGISPKIISCNRIPIGDFGCFAKAFPPGIAARALEEFLCDKAKEMAPIGGWTIVP